MTPAQVKRKRVNSSKYKFSDFMRPPPKLCATRGVVNVQNGDKRSFMWSVLAVLFPSRQNYRTSFLQKHVDKINMRGIECPVSLKSIDTFEELNPDISVNVFGYEEEVYPVRMSTRKGRKRHIYLIMLAGKTCNRYCAVTSLSRLLHHLNPTIRTHYYCKYCFQRFVSKHSHLKHVSMCENLPVSIKVIMKHLKCKKHTPEGYNKGECN